MGAFQSTAFQNDAFQITGAVAGNAFQCDAFQRGAFQDCTLTFSAGVVVPVTLGGGGEPFIWWGPPLKPRRRDEIEEVEDAIEVIETYVPVDILDNREADIIAERLLAGKFAAQLRQILAAQEFAAQIEQELRNTLLNETLLEIVSREIREMDDEDVLLLTS